MFGRDPTPGEGGTFNKMGVEHAIDVTNNPSMKAQDPVGAGHKDWKSLDPNMTNRDYLKSLEPKDKTASTLTQPNPSFPQNGVGTIGDPSAMMKLPQRRLFGGRREPWRHGLGAEGVRDGQFGDLGAAQKAFGGSQGSVFGAGARAQPVRQPARLRRRPSSQYEDAVHDYFRGQGVNEKGTDAILGNAQPRERLQPEQHRQERRGAGQGQHRPVPGQP